MTRSFVKDPSDVLDYVIDWSAQMTEDGADTIALSTWTVPTGITQDSESETTTTATIWLSSGVDGTDYDCANKIVTAAARTYERTITIQVRNR